MSGMRPENSFIQIKNTPAIQNIDILAADTEYGAAIPANCKSLRVQCRQGTALRIAFVTGKVAGTADIYTVKANDFYYTDKLRLTAGSLYIGSGTTLTVAEVITWT